jgi:hypothetical protein
VAYNNAAVLKAETIYHYLFISLRGMNEDFSCVVCFQRALK